ncbi:hypothetical protein RR48_06954 [Papilio machaon]|uniref:Uncharacterized protein n=1 Tax=Papilio machaon TaxID=76193 RepID=A0A194R9M2_PAPMA|nr:hypothetical protein RR48_06954 [Papilio machaon]
MKSNLDKRESNGLRFLPNPNSSLIEIVYRDRKMNLACRGSTIHYSNNFSDGLTNKRSRIAVDSYKREFQPLLASYSLLYGLTARVWYWYVYEALDNNHIKCCLLRYKVDFQSMQLDDEEIDNLYDVDDY